MEDDEMDGCIFCSIAKGTIPSATIYENSEFKVILDIAPVSKGHTLILTKEHYDNIFDMDADTASKLFSLATEVARAMKNELKCDGLNVVQNNGEVAGQTVNHFHLHLIPRYAGDDVGINFKGSDTADSEELQALAKKIRKRI